MTKPRQFCTRGHDTFQVGRDAGHRCLACRAEDADAVQARYAAESAQRAAELQRRWDEIEARHEREYQAALEAGGETAAYARWQRRYDEVSPGWGLCQWAFEDSGEPGACFTRTNDIYCAKHNRQSERGSGQETPDSAGASLPEPSGV